MNEHMAHAGGFWVEDWFVQPRLGRIVRRQIVVSLRPRVMEVLVALADRAGDVMSKGELVDVVWSSGFVSDNTITHCIKELRKDLGDTTKPPRLVQTIPRRGYRLTGSVRTADSTGGTSLIDQARFMLAAERLNVYLVDGENVIGRGGEAQIVIQSSWISRHHARIVVGEHGVTIEDLGSKNGTFVCDQMIDQPTRLCDGDVLRIGDHRFEFRSWDEDGRDATWTMQSPSATHEPHP